MIVQDNSAHVDSRVYNGDAAFVTQGYSEINSKRGTQFSSQVAFTSIISGSTVRYSFTTNGLPVLIKSRQLSGEFSDLTYTVYTEASVSGGTPVDVTNMSDRNPQSTGVVILESPTVVDQGDLWFSRRVLGSNRFNTVNYGQSEGERVLKESTTYLVEITHNDNGIIPVLLVDLYWYQGEIDLDIRETD